MQGKYLSGDYHLSDATLVTPPSHIQDRRSRNLSIHSAKPANLHVLVACENRDDRDGERRCTIFVVARFLVSMST